MSGGKEEYEDDSFFSDESDDVAPIRVSPERSSLRASYTGPLSELKTIEENSECNTERTVESSRSSVQGGDKSTRGRELRSPEDLLPICKIKADNYSVDKKTDKAIKEFIKCVAYSRIVYGSENWNYGKAVCDLGVAYLELKNWPVQAHYHCNIAQNILKSDVQEQADRVADKRSQIPTVPEEEIDDWNIKIYTAVAKLAAKQKKHAKALTYFEKVLNIIEDTSGRESSELVGVYQYMGSIKLCNDSPTDIEKGIEYYHKAHSISMTIYKDGSLESADSARKLAAAYACLGTEDAEISSESYLNECLLTYQTNLGDIHEKTIQVQDDLVKLMLRTDRKEDALILLRKLIEPKCVVHGEFSEEVSESYKLIGSVLLSNGEDEKALKALNKCYTIQCFSHGENARRTKDTKKTIDMLISNPNLAAVHKKLSNNLQDRPNFNSVVCRSSRLGGFKTDATY
ncbi:DgyrCDS8952 [Dimorphilus gyrociliatus]|uniref:DgyrCDS8952 n=1 Tax=Dimorphilus gyrociliatus TaxID=2664684 RepID=A0A7I8VVM4_9ANNE|nr:DgyrCDS8952 [Dimorphilus gyrociliatus]